MYVSKCTLGLRGLVAAFYKSEVMGLDPTEGIDLLLSFLIQVRALLVNHSEK